MANYILNYSGQQINEILGRDIPKIYSGICHTAAETAQKDVICASYTQTGDPQKGDIIFVTFDNTNSASTDDLTLKVNNSTAKHIQYQATSSTVDLPIVGLFIANNTYRFQYNGTNWIAMLNYDTNTNTQQRTYAVSGNVEYPIAGVSNGSTFTSPLVITSSYKSCYAAVPSLAANKATINTSTGKITVPGGIQIGTSETSSITDTAQIYGTATIDNINIEESIIPENEGCILGDEGWEWDIIYSKNYVGSAQLDGTPTAPTAAAGTNTTQIATTAFVQTAISNIPETYTKSEVDALINSGAPPQYVIDESESVLAKAFAHKGLGRTIRFIAVSDSHNDATKASHDYTRVSNLHCGQAVKYIADRIPLDFVASLGDMTWAGVAHTTAQYQTDWLKADIQEMNMFLKDGFSGVPNIRVVGNHDQCATTDSGGTVSRLQNNGAYQYFGRYNAGVNDGLSNYGYYDIENVKLRIIYLNTSDTVSTTSQGTLLGVSQEQKNWLCETLIDVNSKSDAANWKILLLSHAPLDMVSGIAADILIPYTNGGTYGSYTFTNHSAKIIGNCHGHTHCYRVDYMADKIRRFTIPNSNFYDNNHYKDNANYSAWNEDTTYSKTANSRTDTSFSLVTVDLDSLTCYVDNYGAGYDREFSLDYKSAPAPVNLFDKNDADVVLRARFNSSHVPASWDASQLITGYIEVTAGDTFTVSGDNTQNLNVYTGVAQLYNSNKEYIGIYSSPVQDPTHQKWVWAADYLSGSLDTSVAPNNGTNSGAAYIRFCLAYTNIDNLVITK